MVCSRCNGEYADSTKFCPHCGAATEFDAVETPQINQNNPYDVPSVLLNIICFFKPFIGLILYLSWKMEYPKKAKGVGMAALIGVILRLFGFLILVLLGATLFAPYIAEIIEEIMWYF